MEIEEADARRPYRSVMQNTLSQKWLLVSGKAKCQSKKFSQNFAVSVNFPGAARRNHHDGWWNKSQKERERAKEGETCWELLTGPA